MTDMITFYLIVKYKSPSKEWSFLEKGWGIRDVRGPYLNTFTGHICISNEILLPEIPSTISLTLSLSNRCPTASILVQALASNRKVIHSVNRNDSADFVFESVVRDSTGKFQIEISIPSVKTATEQKKYSDILAIDEIIIERLR
jgi:hypothetical protein